MGSGGRRCPRPSAASRCAGLVNIHGLENSEDDLRAVPARQVRNRGNGIEFAEPCKAAVKVEPVYGPVLQRVDRVVDHDA